MKKLFLSMMLLALPLLVSAYDAEVDGICYKLNSEEKTAEVAFGTYCTGSVNIPEKFNYEGVEYSVTSIGESAFYNSSSMTSVKIPNSVTTIGRGAFYNCSSLTSLSIPNSVTSISGSAFELCSALTSVNIPNSVTRIREYAFKGCSSLSSVSIHNSITYIGWYAFDGCSSLTSIVIPNSVTYIGYSAFRGCSNLVSVIIPNSVNTIESYTFCDCSNLTSIEIPESVTSIGESAFYGCKGLTSLSIGNSVKTIEYCAFGGCTTLSSVKIGGSVNYIDHLAFSDWRNLKFVYCFCEGLPNAYTDAFGGSNLQNATLYVLNSVLNDYKTTEPWSQFGTIRAIGDSEEGLVKCATPTISYADKKLTFSCETEEVEYHYTITDSDIKSDVSSSIDLSATYEISVYATKSGYTNSDVATATLVWTDAIFTETTPSTSSAKAVQESIPMLISAKGGNISVKCEADGQEVNVYTIDGQSFGSATVKNGEALISTSIQSGEIAVVKVGGRSVKVIMR